MLTRRHIRIKIFQVLYAFFNSNNENIIAGKKQLIFSIEKFYDLYIYLLMIFENLKRVNENIIEERKSKPEIYKNTKNLNEKFVKNALIALIEANSHIQENSRIRKINWVGDDSQDVIKNIYIQLRKSSFYEKYMESSKSSFEEDKQFIIDVFCEIIIHNEVLLSHLEEKNIYWIDDIDIVALNVIKTLESFTEESDSKHSIIELYRNKEEDLEYLSTLFDQTVKNKEENAKYIHENSSNWELERIANTDQILMQMAIAEVTSFSSIPTKVTLNEYIEISKYYSTPKSDKFINGILDKIFAQLTKENKIKKIGRGLINESKRQR